MEKVPKKSACYFLPKGRFCVGPREPGRAVAAVPPARAELARAEIAAQWFVAVLVVLL
jgi:hypothetical protein